MDNTKIGDILLANGIINLDQLQTALHYQEKHGGLIGLILVNLKIITPEQLQYYLSVQKKDRVNN